MNKFLPLIATLFLLSCNETNRSTVLTKAEFTDGIEGPAVSSDGDLYVVNFKEQGTIGIIEDGMQSAELFCQLPEGSVGNGIRFLNDSVCFIADYLGHNILSLNINTKEVKVFAHNDDMNQPNDLAISSKGILYASDPNWEEGTGQLWMVDADGHMMLVDDKCGTTNGVEVSMDEKYLFVNESVQRKVWKYTIGENGIPGNKELFHTYPDHGLDGMRCDARGRLWIARYGAGCISVLNQDGIEEELITLNGEKPTNVAFGGRFGMTLFITMQDKGWVEKFKCSVQGRSHMMRLMRSAE